jgi:hypothetical protein
MSDAHVWRDQISELDRKQALGIKIKQEGLAFIRQGATALVPKAAQGLQQFLESSEGDIVEKWLARVPINTRLMNERYISTVAGTPNTDHVPQGGYFTLASPVQYGSKFYSFFCLTADGLRKFSWTEGFFRGQRFVVRPIEAEDVARGRVDEILRLGMYTRIDHETVKYWNDTSWLSGTWDDWTAAMRRELPDLMDLAQTLRKQMSAALHLMSG